MTTQGCGIEDCFSPRATHGERARKDRPVAEPLLLVLLPQATGGKPIISVSASFLLSPEKRKKRCFLLPLVLRLLLFARGVLQKTPAETPASMLLVTRGA